MLLHHAMHPRLPNHGNQVSNLQHPDEDPLISRMEAFSDGEFAIAITLLALRLEVPQVQLAASPSLLLHALLAERSGSTTIGCLATATGQPTGSSGWLNLIPFAPELLGEYALRRVRSWWLWLSTGQRRPSAVFSTMPSGGMPPVTTG